MANLGKHVISKKQLIALVASIAAGLAIIGFTYASSRVYRYSRVKNHFFEIRKGQSKEEVLNTIGSPDEVSNCRSEDRECVETFWYYGFIERWAVYLDGNARVIDTNYNVSP